jgi:hypothetical protein
VTLLRQFVIKKTAKLFLNKYQYKVALKTAAAHWFRTEVFTKIEERLADPDNSIKKYIYNVKSLSDENGLSYVKSIYSLLSAANDYSIRVESPILSIYTNDMDLINRLADLNQNLTKYICVPAFNLNPGEVFSRKLNFLYKVHFGITTQNYKNFVEWCENTNKVRITKKSKNLLSRDRSYLGGYFYVKDEKTLTMVKIFLGSTIKKIETIVK